MDRGTGAEYFGGILPLRFLLICTAYALTVATVNLMGYPSETRTAVYLLGILVALDLSIEIFSDVFRAHERMGVVSLINLVSGLALTALSVCVLLLGYKLVGVIAAYIAGKALGFLVAAIVYARNFSTPRLSLDRDFWKTALARGFPLFISSQLWIFLSQIDVITLSKMSTMNSIGIYTAATVLLTKLTVIPQSIASSVYPTISSLQNSPDDTGKALCRKVFFFILLVGLPAAIGIDIISYQVINLIYGARYAESARILQIVVWVFPLIGFQLVSVSVLFATNNQNKVVKVYAASLVLAVVLQIFLIRSFDILGAAVGLVLSMTFQSCCMSYMVRDYLKGFFSGPKFRGIIISNLILTALLLLLYRYNLFLIIIASVPCYLSALLLFKIIMPEDLVKLKGMIAKNRA
jgi:O-antigen/teichoic acid export membrane protein